MYYSKSDILKNPSLQHNSPSSHSGLCARSIHCFGQVLPSTHCHPADSISNLIGLLSRQRRFVVKSTTTSQTCLQSLVSRLPRRTNTGSTMSLDQDVDESSRKFVTGGRKLMRRIMLTLTCTHCDIFFPAIKDMRNHHKYHHERHHSTRE